MIRVGQGLPQTIGLCILPSAQPSKYTNEGVSGLVRITVRRMTFSDANPWPRDLTAARELDALTAPTGRRVFLHLSSFDDGGWEDIHVLCPVSQIRCSQDVLLALKDQLDREIFAKSPCYVDSGDGFVQLSYVQSDATPLADNTYGRIVEGIYFGNEFINLGLPVRSEEHTSELQSRL